MKATSFDGMIVKELIANPEQDPASIQGKAVDQQIRRLEME